MAEIDEVLTAIGGLCGRNIVTDHKGEDLPFPYRCTLGPPVPWDRDFMERKLRLSIPPDLEGLWRGASRLHLYEDFQYRKWGLILWSPDEVLTRDRNTKALHGEEFRPADLVIGEFLGDRDLLAIRCEPSLADFGAVFVVAARRLREDWYFLNLSLGRFLDLYVGTTGDKWWEVHV